MITRSHLQHAYTVPHRQLCILCNISSRGFSCLYKTLNIFSFLSSITSKKNFTSTNERQWFASYLSKQSNFNCHDLSSLKTSLSFSHQSLPRSPHSLPPNSFHLSPPLTHLPLSLSLSLYLSISFAL